MSFVATKAKYNVALDGVGLLLQGTPNAPGYRMTNAPVYGTRFASGDRDYNDLSQWWYLIQTDWSGGFKDTLSFEDDAKFLYSSNIDARTKPGTLRLEKALTQVYDNTSNSEEVLDLKTMVVAGNDRTHFMDNDTVRTLSGTAAFDSDGSPNYQLAHKGYMWVFGTRVANSNTASPYPFVTNDKTSQINGLIDGSIDSLGGVAAAVVGTALYVAGVSTVGKLWVVKTTVADPASGADWTLVGEVSIDNSLGASITGMEVLGDEVLILVEGSPVWTLTSVSVSAGTLTKLKEFGSSNQTGIFNAGCRHIIIYNATALITICNDGSDDEDGEIWKYDGNTLERIYSTSEEKSAFSTREAKAWLKGGGVVYNNFVFWGNLVWDGESFFNFIKSIDDDVLYTAIPIGTDGGLLYVVDNEDISGDTQTIIYSYDKDGTSYKTGASHSAFLVFSQHDKLQSIDKLLNTITIGFEKFLSGQEISIYYSTNPIPDPNITTGSWTLLGTASYALDGADATFKKFSFPVGTTAKKIWFRVELVGGGSDTPGMTDFTLEYLPMPDYKKQWAINVNCADEVKNLAGRHTELTARELKGRLERAWWTKSALDWQDLDYASTTLADNPLSAVATTVTLASTADFPEQGRIKIDEEEILYTGKTATTLTGCTRGARGTRAASHTTGSVVNNAYRVIITDIDVRVPVLNEDKNLEYIVGISLREV